jgi:hypothetical protein
MFYSTSGLAPPSGFAHGWKSIVEPHELQRAAAIAAFGGCPAIIVVDIIDEKQVQAAVDFIFYILHGAEHTPTTILLPHSAQYLPDTACYQVFSRIVNAGVDDVVVGQPVGLRLAVAVRVRLTFVARFSRRVKDVQQQSQTMNHAHTLRYCIDQTLWSYLRVRMPCGIPDIDTRIASGDEMTLFLKWRCVNLLGKGAFGQVWRIRDDAESTDQVIKIMAKDGIDTARYKRH